MHQPSTTQTISGHYPFCIAIAGKNGYWPYTALCENCDYQNCLHNENNEFNTYNLLPAQLRLHLSQKEDYCQQ
jgi:hypothetical protein